MVFTNTFYSYKLHTTASYYIFIGQFLRTSKFFIAVGSCFINIFFILVGEKHNDGIAPVENQKN